MLRWDMVEAVDNITQRARGVAFTTEMDPEYLTIQ